VPATAAETQRGRPFTLGQSGNAVGSHKGARKKATILAEVLLGQKVEVLVQKLPERTREGDVKARAISVAVKTGGYSGRGAASAILPSAALPHRSDARERQLAQDQIGSRDDEKQHNPGAGVALRSQPFNVRPSGFGAPDRR